jgi:CheY-like chemotaxis protein
MHRHQARLLGLRVLVVDDNEVARSAQAGALRRMGLRSDTASGGQEALEAVRRVDSEGDPYAAVILDGQMPGMDGVETAARLRALALRQPPRLLLATAYGDDDLVRRAAEGTFAAVLAKPITPSSLHDRLLEVFHVAWPPPPVPATAIAAHGPDEQARDQNARPDRSCAVVEDPARRTAPAVAASARVDANPRPEPYASTDSPEAATAPGTLSGLHVLVVDDNEINLLIAREMLVAADAVVDTAEDGQQAVDRLRAQRFDLVLMDMQMPVMDGLEATRRIREMPGCASLPVLAMTANAMVSDRERCLQAGMDEVLTKPIDPSSLLTMVGHWARAVRPQVGDDAVPRDSRRPVGAP